MRKRKRKFRKEKYSLITKEGLDPELAKKKEEEEGHIRYKRFVEGTNTNNTRVILTEGHTLEPPLLPIDHYAVEYPVIASPYLFGVKVVLQNDKLYYIRKDKAILSPVRNRHIVFRLGRVKELGSFVGVVTVGAPTRENRSTISRRYLESQAPLPDNFRINLVDIRNPHSSFIKRTEVIENYNDGLFIGLKHQALYNTKELSELEIRLLQMGYGGVMLHVPYAKFYYGRVTYLKPIIFHRKAPHTDIGTISSYRRNKAGITSLSLENKRGVIRRIEDKLREELQEDEDSIIGKKVLYCYWREEDSRPVNQTLLKVLGEDEVSNSITHL